MKIKNLKTLFVTLMTIMLLAITHNRANASNYFTIYMDSIIYSDTLTVCNNFDMIKVVPMKGLINPMFYGQQGLDSIHTDTLYLPTSFTGALTCQGSDGVNWQSKCIFIFQLTLTSTDRFITCGTTPTLNIYTNYKGKGTLEYNWNPSTGLSNPNIANPVAKLKNNMTYVVTVKTTEGCQLLDTFRVYLQPMDSPSICIVGVDSTTNKNIIIWDKPYSTSIDSFFIYKETDVTDVYDIIGALDYKSNSIFMDNNSHPDIQSNKYKVSLKDSCGFESEKSAAHKTMHLAINQGQNNTWNLIWEPYEGFTVSSYNIYRGTSSKNLQLIGTTSGGSTQYSDFSALSGYVYYQIEVVSPNVCNPSGYSSKKAAAISTSRSNIASNSPLGTTSLTNPESFAIYPNPATDQLFIESEPNSGDYVIEITNMEGQQILKQTLKLQQTHINISFLHSGLYIVKITSGRGVTTEKLVKR